MSLSSNDLLADRRFAWAQALAEEGDHAAAADLLGQVAERVPNWAPGWAALAEARERGGDRDGARAAWARAAALDEGGSLGAEPNLARLDGRTPAGLPETYVRALFDGYAPRFERHLTAALGYRGPAVLVAALDRIAPGRRFARALDLGCGTGLMGLALAGRAAAIDGVDLSPAMVERARAAGVYAALEAGPLDAALAASPAGTYDLVVAADVMVYLGDLAPVFAGASRALAPGGLLAFTAETPPAGVPPALGFALGPGLRFAHAPGHLAAGLRAVGLTPRLLDPASTRTERGTAVPGLAAVASKD